MMQSNNQKQLPVSHCPNCGIGLRFDRNKKIKIRCPKCNYSGAISTYSLEADCLDCGKKILISNLSASAVICPHCRNRRPMSLYLNPRPFITPQFGREKSDDKFEDSYSSSEAEGGSPIGGDTIINAPKTEINSGSVDDCRPGSLFLVDDGGYGWNGDRGPIRLKVGRCVFGRMSPTSKADHKLPTADMTVSKSHFCIEMIVMPNGKIIHRLSDADSTNGTYYNDQRIAPGDIVVLTPGGKIRVGHTIFKFDII